MVETVPFWTADYPKPAELGTDSLPSQADVVIVGSGVTGLAAARRLAAGHRHVVVVDRGPIAGGASSISGGMITPGLKVPAPAMVRRHGRGLGLELWQASNRSIDLVADIVRDEEIQCDLLLQGGAGLGYTERDRRSFEASARWLEVEAGFQERVVAGSEVRDVVGSDRFPAAYVIEHAGGVHPAKYSYGLAAAAARKGALLIEHAEVIGVVRRGATYSVSTPQGTVQTPAVLVATNGYSGGLIPEIRRRIVPIGSYIVVTEPLGAEQAERLIPGNRMLWTARRFLNYFRRTSDERLLMGGRQNLRTDLDLTESAKGLRRTIEDFFPELRGVEVTHSWSGHLAVTFDLVPHLGRVNGIWYALGYSGHGMALGTQLGHDVAGLMLGEVERSPFAEIPFPSRWYYRERPWFLPFATWWYRLLDAAGR